jgi:hypothetical protein
LSVAIDAALPRVRRRSLFYSGMSVAFLVIVFAGFARTYYLRPLFHPQPLIPLLHLHGILFSSWIVMLFAQTTLVAAGRTDIHRRLGVAGGVLAALMVVVGTATGIIRGRNEPLDTLTIPLGDMLVFAILVAAALLLRRRIEWHKRLMMLATITVLPAAVARLPFDFIQRAGALAFFGLPDLLVVVLLAHDVITRGGPHRATVLGGALLIASHPLRSVVGATHAWLAFARWVTQ